jgi:Cu+-exporting ATPase
MIKATSQTMSEQKKNSPRLDLPIAGMTCAACATRIEKVLNRLPGVMASVNLASERAQVALSPGTSSPQEVVAAIAKAGFSVPQQTTELAIEGMTCAACSTRLEKLLNRLPGVEAVVNLATERATLRHTPGMVDPALLLATVERAGFVGRLADNRCRNEEKAKKIAAEQAELRRFWMAAALTLPLAAQMLTMFDVGGGQAHPDLLPRWLQLALATPVQFWLGWRFYAGAWKALRGGGANMDLLVALGTSMAYGFSLFVTVSGAAHLHVYFEASAAVITLVLLGKLLEARAKARTTDAIEALVRLQPKTARVERDGRLIELDAALLIPGDIFVVRRAKTCRSMAKSLMVRRRSMKRCSPARACRWPRSREHASSRPRPTARECCAVEPAASGNTPCSPESSAWSPKHRAQKRPCSASPTASRQFSYPSSVPLPCAPCLAGGRLAATSASP